MTAKHATLVFLVKNNSVLLAMKNAALVKDDITALAVKLNPANQLKRQWCEKLKRK